MTVTNALEALARAQNVVSQFRMSQDQDSDQNSGIEKQSLEKIVSIFSHTSLDGKEETSKTLEELAKECVKQYPESKPFIVQVFPNIKISKITQIFVRCNVNWGNTIAIRGNGPGLTWDKDTDLICKDVHSWSWETPLAFKGPCEFKVLFRNATESTWEQIDHNRIIHCNEKVVVVPVFSQIPIDLSRLSYLEINKIHQSQFLIEDLKDRLDSIEKIVSFPRIGHSLTEFGNSVNRENLIVKRKKKGLDETIHTIVTVLDPHALFNPADDLLSIEDRSRAYLKKYPFVAPFLNQIISNQILSSQEEPGGDSLNQDFHREIVSKIPDVNEFLEERRAELFEGCLRSLPIEIRQESSTLLPKCLQPTKSEQAGDLKPSGSPAFMKLKDPPQAYNNFLAKWTHPIFNEEVKEVPTICRYVRYPNHIYLEVVIGNMFQQGQPIDFRVIASSRDHRQFPGGQAAAALNAMGPEGRKDYFSKVEGFFQKHRLLKDRDFGYRVQGNEIRRFFAQTTENLVPLMDIGTDVLVCSGGDVGGEYLWVNGPNLKNPQPVEQKKSESRGVPQDHLELQQIWDAYSFAIMMSVKRSYELNIKSPVVVALPLISSQIYGLDPRISLPHVFKNLKSLIPNIYEELRKEIPEMKDVTPKEFYFKFYELSDSKNVQALIETFDQVFDKN